MQMFYGLGVTLFLFYIRFPKYKFAPVNNKDENNLNEIDEDYIDKNDFTIKDMLTDSTSINENV